MKLRLPWPKAQTATFIFACVVSIDSTLAQIDDCVAQLNSCIESVVIPNEAVEGGRLLDEVWLMLGQSRELGEGYFVEEVGLQQQSALALAEYALWAFTTMNAHNKALQDHYCGLLEGVTTGPELHKLDPYSWDWEQLKFQEVDRLSIGVFAILSEREAAVLLAYLNELMQEPSGYSGTFLSRDIETWSDERVARFIGSACEPYSY